MREKKKDYVLRKIGKWKVIIHKVGFTLVYHKHVQIYSKINRIEKNLRRLYANVPAYTCLA